MKGNMPENLTTRLLQFVGRTPLGFLADGAFKIQYYLWRRKPGLVLRLSDFMPVGVGSALLQIMLLFLFEKLLDDNLATLLSVGCSVFLNYLLNRSLTWKERLERLTPWQNRLMFVPLFVMFAAFAPSVWIKWIILPWLQHQGLSLLAAWTVSEFACVGPNYILADKIFFGLLTRAVEKLGEEHNRIPRVLDHEIKFELS